jgi:hypothetical protein
VSEFVHGSIVDFEVVVMKSNDERNKNKMVLCIVAMFEGFV